MNELLPNVSTLSDINDVVRTYGCVKGMTDACGAIIHVVELVNGYRQGYDICRRAKRNVFSEDVLVQEWYWMC